jgi:putative membrane protein
MVKILSDEDNAAIGRAVREVEVRTDAEFAAVIAPASSGYTEYVLFDAFILGSLIGLSLWAGDIDISIPIFVIIQLVTMASLIFLPPLRMIFIRLLPKHVLHRHAAKQAGLEFMHLSHHAAASKPIVLLYVSLAERYVHILYSRNVREKIPLSEWNDIVQRLTASMATKGVKESCSAAITEISKLLMKEYPRQKAG